MQAPYPILLEAAGISCCQNDAMEPIVFDAELVRRTLRDKGISQTTLATELGFTSQSAISNILTTNPAQKPRKVSAQEAHDIYRFLGLLNESQVQAGAIRVVPLIGFASAGSWGEAIAHPLGNRPIAHREIGPKAFAVEIVGDSMDRLLPEGGWAVVDPDQRGLLNGRVYLIENEDFETTVKQYRSEPARFVPVSNNARHQEMLVDTLNFRIIGRIISYGGDA
jgi:SOS-response transcriptional repressor LexA